MQYILNKQGIFFEINFMICLAETQGIIWQFGLIIYDMLIIHHIYKVTLLLFLQIVYIKLNRYWNISCRNRQCHFQIRFIIVVARAQDKA